ncbi:sigma-70 family RNA polymerase sigma factor [Romboutsia sp.]|uniref:sigma-70 family RNA polymerase sigma factor n=1 Tax=Romboutsia sp. TaxID=1965302 RepID=UPI003F381350
MDNKIIRKIKDRDNMGLNLLINSYAKNIYYIISTVIGDNGSQENIEECMKNTFSNIWNDIYEIDREKISFKTFILKKSKKTAMEYKSRLEHKDEKQEAVIEEEKNNSERSKEVVNIIKSFKNPDKTYFYLNYIMNYDIETIAEKYGESISTVQNTLCRCRLKLKNIIEKEVIVDGK